VVKTNSMKAFTSPPGAKLGRFAALFALLALCTAAACNRNHPPPIAQTAGPTVPNSTGIPPLTEQSSIRSPRATLTCTCV
jgi:hypothetical protein